MFRKLSNNKMYYSIRYFILFISTLCISITTYAQSFNMVGNCNVRDETWAMKVLDDKLYHSGFDSLCGTPLKGMAIWNDSTWYRLGVGQSSVVEDWDFYNNELVVVGGFYLFGGKSLSKIARWNGNDWFSVGMGVTGEGSINHFLNAIEVYKNELYVGGKFREIDGKNIQHIARWNGTEWNAVGSGVSASLPQVDCMIEYKGELYVGGNISVAGGRYAYGIARWNGQTWNTLKLGLNNDALTMVVDTVKDLLYIGGAFNAANNSKVKGSVVAWDGTNWLQVGDPVKYRFNSAVLALEMYHGYLYAAGVSNWKDTDTVLARWDGQNWEPIVGFNGSIRSLATYKDELFIGGGFTRIGNDSIPYLTRYYSPDYVTVGINSEQKLTNNHIKIFPNPTKDIIQIESQIPIMHYKITDLNGRVVQEGKMSTRSVSIDKLDKAVYLIHFFDEEQRNIGTEKFVLE